MMGPVPLVVLAAEDAAKAAAGAGDFRELATRGGVALLIGILVGAEREYSHTEKEELFAGVRTFPLIALLGFTAALLGGVFGSPLVFAAVSGGFCLLVVAAYVLTSLKEDKGATTEIAGLTVYFLGALCWWSSPETLKFASAAAVVAAVLLSLREAIHGVVSKFEREDIYATLKLAIVSLIVLPLLPDQAFGPFNAFNPHKTWKYTVLIAGISFAGYVAVKVLGARRGVGVTGIFGGLASSTAVALAFSRKSREEPRLARSFASAIVLASTIMFPRVLVYAAGACPSLLDRLWKPVAVLTAVGAVASALLYLGGERDEKAGEGVTLKNPFELGSAIKFGVVLAIIGFVSRAAYETFRENGYYVVSVLLGLADADGFAMQAASRGQEDVLAAQAAARAAGAEAPSPAGIPFLSVATTAIVLAMIANTVVKGGMTVTLGSRELRRYTIPAFGAMAAIGVAAAFLLV